MVQKFLELFTKNTDLNTELELYYLFKDIPIFNRHILNSNLLNLIGLYPIFENKNLIVNLYNVGDFLEKQYSKTNDGASVYFFNINKQNLPNIAVNYKNIYQMINSFYIAETFKYQDLLENVVYLKEDNFFEKMIKGFQEKQEIVNEDYEKIEKEYNIIVKFLNENTNSIDDTKMVVCKYLKEEVTRLDQTLTKIKNQEQIYINEIKKYQELLTTLNNDYEKIKNEFSIETIAKTIGEVRIEELDNIKKNLFGN